jgi:hypothetical protein
MDDVIDGDVDWDRQIGRQRVLAAFATAGAVPARRRAFGARVRALIALRRPITG